MPDQKFKVAAAQAGSVFRDAPDYFDTAATLAKAISFINEAGKHGARLIVFPECFLPCYPHWSLDMADRTNFNDTWAKYLWSAIEVPGKETEALCSAARNAGIFVAMGLTERDRTFAGRMYNSVLYIDDKGKILGTHRKICNTLMERFFHTPGDGGDNLKTVYKTDIGMLGGSICGEHCQLMLTQNWIIQGIQVHTSLWPGRRGLETHQDVNTRALCLTGHCFGVISAGYMSDADFPKKFYKNSRFNIPNAFHGGSGIVVPNGEYIAGPVWDEETIVYGDINLGDCDRAKASVNLSGIYSRWDIMNLNVRQESYAPIVPMPVEEDRSFREKALEARVKELEQTLAKLSLDKKAD